MDYDGTVKKKRKKKNEIEVYVLIWKEPYILVKKMRFEAVYSIPFLFKGIGL